MRDPLDDVVRERWEQWARVRWPLGKRKEQQAWQEFQDRGAHFYARAQQEAGRRGGRLDYQPEQLLLWAVRGLDQGCVLCGRAFGHAGWALAYQVSPSVNVGPEMLGKRNILVTCGRCADAMGNLDASVWLDVLQALKASQDWIAEQFIDRLIAAKVLPRPAPAAGNARAAESV